MSKGTREAQRKENHEKRNQGGKEREQCKRNKGGEGSTPCKRNQNFNSYMYVPDSVVLWEQLEIFFTSMKN